jgi:hypothetical protein
MAKGISFLTATLILVTCASFGSELLAQSSQTVNPVPITPPSLNTTTLSCQINCDTQAMNCMNNCIPTTGLSINSAGAVGSATTNPSCNNACSTQQLVYKQQC